MDRKLMTVLAVCFCMTAVSSASAGEPVRLQEGSVRLTQEQLCEMVRRCRQGQGSDECQEARRARGNAWRELQNRLAGYERRIAQLESRLGGLSDRDPELDAELDRLRELVGQVNVRLDALMQMQADLNEVSQRVGGLQEDNERMQRELEEGRARVARLEAQINEVARRNGVVQISPSGGFVGIYSLDGSYYTGGLAGMRVSLRVNRRLGVFAEPMVTAAVNEYPLGSVIRGGLMVYLTDWVLLETAVSGMWVGFDSQLDAKAAYLTGDVGVLFRPIDWLELGLTLNVGVELDYCNPAAAFGGEAMLRFNIPSL